MLSYYLIAETNIVFLQRVGEYDYMWLYIISLQQGLNMKNKLYSTDGVRQRAPWP